MSVVTDLEKVLTRSWRERGLLLEAVLLLAMIRAALLLLPFRIVVRGLRLIEAPPSARVEAGNAQAAEVGWAVQAAASRTPWQSACLVQSLAALLMLRRRGIGAVVVLGIAKENVVPQGLAAHAWLLCGEEVVTGGRLRNRFTPVAAFITARQRAAA